MSKNHLTTTKAIGFSIFDVLAFALVYFVPALSHFSSVPFYLFEPMRIVIILALVHTNKQNAYILAATLPIFSFLTSGHPELIKMLIITSELLLNVMLFFLFTKSIKNTFFSAILSIIAAKTFYYIAKFGFIYFAILKTETFATPIYIQLITTVVLSVYVFFVLSKNKYSKH